MDSSMQLSELRKIAKEKGLKNISKLKKEELLELLNGTENNEKVNEKSVKKNTEIEDEEIETSSQNSNGGRIQSHE